MAPAGQARTQSAQPLHKAGLVIGIPFGVSWVIKCRAQAFAAAQIPSRHNSGLHFLKIYRAFLEIYTITQ